MLVCLGEIMLRLKPPGKNRLLQSPLLEACFGGSEANTAVGLVRLGHKAGIATLLPPNPLGDAAEAQLRQWGVDTTRVLRSEGRLGLYFLEEGALQRPSKVVYDRSGSSFACIRASFWKEDAFWYAAKGLHLSGITPAVSQEARDASLETVRAASERGCPISFDLNHRTQLWRWGGKPAEVLPAYLCLASLVLSNERDLHDALGGDYEPVGGSNPEPVLRRNAERLFGQYPRVAHFAVSLRDSKSADRNFWGGALISRDGSLAISQTYELEGLVDRVGAGDAFGAGILAGLEENLGLQKTVDLAAAFSALKHSIPGDVCLASRSEAESLAAGDSAGRIRR